jgi:ribonuclease Z
MIPFELCILGSGSAIPSPKRMASSQLLSYGKHHFLIDCAEGTQLQLRVLKISPMRIDSIFISHLHGDHYFGLMGLLNSLHLIGRTEVLHLFGPAMLADIIRIQLDASETKLRFPLVFHALQPDQKSLILESEQMEVYSYPVSHRIPTWGFLFKERLVEPNIRHDFIDRFHPDTATILQIKHGADFIDEQGQVHMNEELVSFRKCRSYAYCTDTALYPPVANWVKGASLLYHETTFMENQSERARETFHSTTLDAARMASMAEVDRLLIGHFSSRYPDTEILLNEVKSVFPNAIAAVDGLKIGIE